ncbi:hypothetical protein GGX14DRAFT_636006 [Mycena pura]|uniref:NTF2 domain-containing protein n=1 Tax=Mycena pura TaxID=153505 RepID=A0AAD6VDY3_9AGAR|nr:hypothetical protein GGX14DRAFT_636006 [Mycena pura]
MNWNAPSSLTARNLIPSSNNQNQGGVQSFPYDGFMNQVSVPSSTGFGSMAPTRNTLPSIKAAGNRTPSPWNIPSDQTVLPLETRVPNSPPPLKRRRIEPNETLPSRHASSHVEVATTRVSSPVVKTEELPIAVSTSALRNPKPPLTPVRVKLEPCTVSPPPPDPPRRAVRSGSKRYFPVPHDCTRMDPNFAANRRSWAYRECAILRGLGLRVEKFFFRQALPPLIYYLFYLPPRRDDGMVIEWTSADEVWLDTLRPVRERSRRTEPEGREIIDVDAEPSDPTPLPPPSFAITTPSVPTDREEMSTTSSHDSNTIAVSADVSLVDQVEEIGAISAEDSASNLASVAAFSVDGVEEMVVDDEVTQNQCMPSEEEQKHLHQLSLDFIRKYILTFDRDRESLASAYAEDAVISFRDNNFACLTHFTFKRTRSSQSKNTMPKLPALQAFRFAARDGAIDVDYDIVVLEPQPDAPDGVVMMSVHGQLVSPDEQTLAIDQTFVLRRNSTTIDDWPLVAVLHQMVVRDTPWVHWTGTLEELTRNIA